MVEVVVRSVKSATVVDLHGRLDYRARWQLKAVINQCCLTEPEHLIVNLEDVTFIDSAGLGFLVLAYLRVTGLKRRMTWIQPKGAVATVFEDLKLRELVPIFTNEQQALGTT